MRSTNPNKSKQHKATTSSKKQTQAFKTETIVHHHTRKRVSHSFLPHHRHHIQKIIHRVQDLLTHKLKHFQAFLSKTKDKTKSSYK